MVKTQNKSRWEDFEALILEIRRFNFSETRNKNGGVYVDADSTTKTNCTLMQLDISVIKGESCGNVLLRYN